jgi:pimeloyl-ACP methyl ester carboxylesterase
VVTRIQIRCSFVHGAGHAACCWDEHFLDFFADRAYRALAESLRGHGGGPTTKVLRNWSVADYIDDVASVADSLPTRPVVIDHLFGGYVVQKYLESHDAPAGVRVASVPPRGIASTFLRYMKQHPRRLTTALVTGKSSAMLNARDTVREKFYSARTPEAVC